MSAAGSISRWRQRSLFLLALDDIKVNAAAFDAAQGPVFRAAAAGDDAQDGEFGIAIRAVGSHVGGGCFGDEMQHTGFQRWRELFECFWLACRGVAAAEAVDMADGVRD